MSIISNYKEILKIKDFRGRPFVDRVVSKMSELWSDVNVFLVDAPTGYGKTLISMSVAKYSVEEELKAIVAYPLRALLENQLSSFREVFRKARFKEGIVDARYMGYFGSHYLVKPVTLTTVDMLSMTIAGVPPEDLGKVSKSLTSWTSTDSLGHYVFSWGSTLSSNVVIDEVHLLGDSAKGLGFIRFLSELVADVGTHLILMSATLTDELVKEAVPPALQSTGKVKVLKFSDYVRSEGSRDPFVEGRVRKKYGIELKPVTNGGVEQVLQWVKLKALTRGLRSSRILLIFNTVREAVEAYESVSNDEVLSKLKHFIIHSKLTRRDRERVSEEVTRLSESEGGSYVVVATQAVEAGVDITSNILATDAAPAATIVQRFGRFLRREGELEGEALIWWSADTEGGLIKSGCGEEAIYKVYRAEDVKSFLKWIKDVKTPNLHLPEIPEGFEGVGYLQAFKPGVNEGIVEGVEAVELPKYLKDILLDFEQGSKRAAELLRRLGGSFIREASLTSVIPSNLLKGNRDLKAVLKEASIPVSSGELCRMLREDYVAGVVTERDYFSREKLSSLIMFRKLMNSCKDLRKCSSEGMIKVARDLMDFQNLNGVVAFVTSLNYREGIGLEFK